MLASLLTFLMAGATVLAYDLKNVAALPNPYKVKLNLAVGRYTLKATSTGGPEVTHEFAVKDLSADQPTIKTVMR